MREAKFNFRQTVWRSIFQAHLFGFSFVLFWSRLFTRFWVWFFFFNIKGDYAGSGRSSCDLQLVTVRAAPRFLSSAAELSPAAADFTDQGGPSVDGAEGLSWWRFWGKGESSFPPTPHAFSATTDSIRRGGSHSCFESVLCLISISLLISYFRLKKTKQNKTKKHLGEGYNLHMSKIRCMFNLTPSAGEILLVYHLPGYLKD